MIGPSSVLPVVALERKDHSPVLHQETVSKNVWKTGYLGIWPVFQKYLMSEAFVGPASSRSSSVVTFAELGYRQRTCGSFGLYVLVVYRSQLTARLGRDNSNFCSILVGRLGIDHIKDRGANKDGEHQGDNIHTDTEQERLPAANCVEG